MMKIVYTLFVLVTFSAWGQSSMRRCTLLPVTDSVGGAVGFKVFELVEKDLKKSDWCTFISNSSLIGVFSRYRDNLPQHLKNKEVLKTVAQKLKVGSVIRLALVNEIDSVELQMEIYGENGEDILFSDVAALDTTDVNEIKDTVASWLNTYAKTIPYHGVLTGVLGDQVTIEVAKNPVAKPGQKFDVSRETSKKKHPLLKKVVDWKTRDLAEGIIVNVSDTQAVGQIKNYKSNQKLEVGDWVRLLPIKEEVLPHKSIDNKKEEPGKLGILSVAIFGTSSSVDTATPNGNKGLSGNLLGLDFRVEGWITRQYFASLEVVRTIGNLKKSSGSPEKDKVNANNGIFKLTGGYKYLPIGFFYGPQIDLYAGYARHTFDLDSSPGDGFGTNNISGILFGVAANIPLNREYKLFFQGEFIPFPSFNDEDDIFGNAKNVSAMELEFGVKYNYTPRMSIDASIETLSRKAKTKGQISEVSYKDNLLKLGVSFNF